MSQELLNNKPLSTEEAAAYIGVATGTLQNWRIKGVGPRYVQHVMRGKVLYRVSDLDEWLAANVRQSTSEAGAV